MTSSVPSTQVRSLHAFRLFYAIKDIIGARRLYAYVGFFFFPSNHLKYTTDVERFKAIQAFATHCNQKVCHASEKTTAATTPSVISSLTFL